MINHVHPQVRLSEASFFMCVTQENVTNIQICLNDVLFAQAHARNCHSPSHCNSLTLRIADLWKEGGLGMIPPAVKKLTYCGWLRNPINHQRMVETETKP